MKAPLKVVIILLAAAVCFGLLTNALAAFDDAALKALIVTGQNNHGWQTSTPILKDLLEQTGLFGVDVAKSPGRDESMEGFKPDFSSYDVVVLDYNGKPWAEATKSAFVDYVKSGGGMVVYHAANNAFPEWKEYNEIIGLGGWGGRDEKCGPYIRWRDGRIVRDTSPGRGGSHGARHDYQVVVRNTKHPVTAGLPERWMHAEDELYSQLRGPAENLTVLATAFADPQQGGTGEHEPILFTVNYGKGRVFHTVMGHAGRGSTSAPPLECVGFIATFQRGAEWAATGKVTQPVPEDFPTATEVSKRTNFKTDKQFEQLLAEIAHYEYGKSRKALSSMDEYLCAVADSPGTLRQIEKRFCEMLGSDDTTAAGKQYICRKLSIIGSEESVGALAAMLTEESSSKIRPCDMARYALERMPFPAAAKALREALSKTSGGDKIGIINSIGERRDSKAVAELFELLNDLDRKVVEAAVAALGKVGGKEAADALGWLRLRIGPQMRPVWANAYLMCADSLAAQGDRKSARRMYAKLSFGGEPEPVRIAAFRGRVLSEPESAPSLVLATLLRSDEKMRSVAVGLLREIPSDEIVKAIGEKYVAFAPRSRVQVLTALGELGNKAALPIVVKASNSPDADVRTSAFAALGTVGDASHVNLLAKTAAGAGGAEQQAARRSLYLLSGPDVDKKVVELIADSEPAVKVELIRAAARRNISQAAETLLETAEASQGSVRLESLKALGVVGEAEQLPALVALLVRAKNAPERNEAIDVIATVAAKSEQKDQQAESILAAMPSVTDRETKNALLQVLGRIGGARAGDALTAALEDDNAETRTAALRAFSYWPDAAPMESLLKVARTADNELHRVLALRGFVRLLGLDTERPAAERTRLYQQAMELAPNTNEKKMVLSGLSKLRTIEALQLAAAYLDVDALRQEAEAAVLQIAKGTTGAYPRQSRVLLKKVAGTSANDAVRGRAEELIKQIEQFEDYIGRWQVSGPYTKENTATQKLFDVVFAPERGSGETARWQYVSTGADSERPWLIDLNKIWGGDDRVAYLRTNIWSDKTQDVKLLVGSNDGIKVWLNGRMVHQNNVLRTIVRDEDSVKVALGQGWNILMLKITQSSGNWSACARFTDLNGNRLEGLKVSADGAEGSAITLIGDDFSTWRDSGAWQVAGQAYLDPANEKRLASSAGTGVIVNGPDGRTVDLLSKAEFGDVKAHIEFMVPRGSNSGVYFMGRYEIQILDSWGVKELQHSDCGGIYQRWDDNRKPKGYEGHPPRINASLPPGQWQSYDIVFRAPRFDQGGAKIANTRFDKVIHNDVVVHENVEVTGPTRASRYKDEKTTGPLMLQGDHGPVAYRNIRIVPLGDEGK